MTNETLEQKVELSPSMAGNVYSTFKEIISDWQFDKYRNSMVYLGEKIAKDNCEKPIEGFNPDLEVAIQCITQPREFCDYDSFFARNVNRCPSEANPREGSANKFKVGDRVISLDLGHDQLQELKDYARDMGKKMIPLRHKSGDIDPIFSRYISLEAIIPFLDETFEFEPYSQPYFNYPLNVIPNYRYNYELADTAMAATQYIISHRNLLGKNKDLVLNSAVNATCSLALCRGKLTYTNPKWENTYSPVGTDIARNTLRKLIKEDSSFEWINNLLCKYDRDWNKPFKDLSNVNWGNVNSTLLAPCEGPCF